MCETNIRLAKLPSLSGDWYQSFLMRSFLKRVPAEWKGSISKNAMFWAYTKPTN
jgi:hypothetical protein